MKSADAKLESFSGSESESDPELLSLSDPAILNGQLDIDSMAMNIDSMAMNIDSMAMLVAPKLNLCNMSWPLLTKLVCSLK